jgi:hypothetical protein
MVVKGCYQEKKKKTYSIPTDLFDINLTSRHRPNGIGGAVKITNTQHPYNYQRG